MLVWRQKIHAVAVFWRVDQKEPSSLNKKGLVMFRKISVVVPALLVLVVVVGGTLVYLKGPALWEGRENPFRAFTSFGSELRKVEEQGGATFNSRTSLVIETPGGLVEGVVVRSTIVSFSAVPSGRGGTLHSEVKGEALVMEVLPGKWMFGLVFSPADPPVAYSGNSVFSIVRSEEQKDKALVFCNSAPEGLGRDITINPETVYEHVPEDATREEERAIKVRNSQLSQKTPRDTFPGLLVMFKDINDPSTIEFVDLADLEATFGEGVKFVSGRYEYTKAPRTEGVVTAGWLPWIKDKEGITLQAPSGTIGLDRTTILKPKLFDTEIGTNK